MYTIGVFTTEGTLRHIMRIDTEMRAQSNITYLPYSSPDHLKFLYEQHMDQFDGVLFSGSYPYELILDAFGPISKPCAYFNVSDRDYYKIIAHLAVTRPQLDFTRVYFDQPDMPVDFHSIFQRSDMPLLGDAPIDWSTVGISDWHTILKDYYQSLWDSGKADLLVVRFSSMEDYFNQHGISHQYLTASPESMLETFRGLMMQLSTVTMHDSAACIGLVSSPATLSDAQWQTLEARLQVCNKQFGMPFLVYEHGRHYELTQQYTTCPVTAFLEGGVDFPVCVGWGCANNVIDAHRNAQRAVKEALLTKGTAAFIVTADNVIIGPLSNVRRITYTDAPSQQLTDLGQRLSISPLYLSKIQSVLVQKGNDTLSAEDLAFFLNITTRSASRILSKLEAGGVATVQYNRQLNLRGRPAKIYKIYFHDLGK
ncbi:MAG: hypothetical protein AAGU23_08135 [Bacillota bacterium]